MCLYDASYRERNASSDFTTRELTNRAPELFAIKALPGNEIIRPGIGGGGAWLQEHLGHDEYAVGWSSVNYVKEENGSFFGLDALLPGVRADEAVLDSGVSRWNNWYDCLLHATALNAARVHRTNF